ncbi:MAG: diadenylate cyclase CdaA [Deltaproteobacteria bacterium]
MFDVIANFKYRDALDIVFVALIVYYILSLIEKTRAAQVLFGLGVVSGLYMLSQVGEFFTLNWILGHFLGSIILIVVILFQNDIRKALITLGKNPLLVTLSSGGTEEENVISEIVKATSLLASRKIGALIAIEGKNSLADFVEIGMKLDAIVSREVIVSIFHTSSPLHDGGMIIKSNRILSAGSFFPLATDPDMGRELGTRHRAAIGLSRETDAIIIIVSEETGAISLAHSSALTRGLDATSLNNRLIELLEIKREQNRGYSFFKRMLRRKSGAEKVGKG